MDRSGFWAEHIKFTLPSASFPRKSSKLSLNLQDASSSLPSPWGYLLLRIPATFICLRHLLVLTPPWHFQVTGHVYVLCFPHKTLKRSKPHYHIPGTVLGNPLYADSYRSTCNSGDLGLIPGSGRSPEEGNGNPLQYSCLGNSTDRGAWWATVHGVTKSQTWLSDSHIDTLSHPASYHLFIPIWKRRKGSWQKISRLPELTQGEKTVGILRDEKLLVILLCSAETYPQPSVVYRISIPPKHLLMDSTIMRGFGEAIGQARGKTSGTWGSSLGSPGPQVEEKLPIEAPHAHTYLLGPAPPTAWNPIHYLATGEAAFPGNPYQLLGGVTAAG